MNIRVEYPWPPSELSPNARPNRFQKAKKAKKHKSDCFLLTKEVMADLVRIKTFPSVEMIAEFYPPMRGGPSPDADNIAAACKWLQDGITAALGINDKDHGIDFPSVCAEKMGKGKIIVEFREAR